MTHTIEVSCECLDCDWEGFTGECLTEGNGDDTLQCPLCRAAVRVYSDQQLTPVGKDGKHG